MEPEPIDEFERELHQAFVRRPAPPGLRQRILDARSRRHTERIHRRIVIWQRLAAVLVLAAAIGGGLAWRQVQQRRKGEEARRQVFTALRITQQALNRINERLTAHSRPGQNQDQE